MLWHFNISTKSIAVVPPHITAHSASAPRSDTALAVTFRYAGSKPRLAILLINAVLSPPGKCACIPLVRRVLLFPLHHTTGGEGAEAGWERGVRGGGLAQACSLQLCPYSQHLTRGPDVHTGNSNNLSNVSPLWDPGTCKGNPAIQHDGVITGLISLHLERTHFNRSNQTLPDRGNNTKMVLHAQHFICTSNKSHSALGTDPISHQVATTSHTAAT